MIDKNKMNILISIDLVVNSIKDYMMKENSTITDIKLPIVIPEESMEVLTE